VLQQHRFRVSQSLSTEVTVDDSRNARFRITSDNVIYRYLISSALSESPSDAP
jgi:hypothetical protein